ncbi:hypothetical protein CCMSSC00406_0006762 [Pleurotus cornucopiae]|uniref:Uncharacterized protein n=1 Tax=Pleurotus cornucopiae TaxID=5321 RepID=A0ACB7IUD9_PLECO|nr:hypothetical protein CCMSSC00406_0006762 [Pleurotus cornucopiae]
MFAPQQVPQLSSLPVTRHWKQVGPTGGGFNNRSTGITVRTVTDHPVKLNLPDVTWQSFAEYSYPQSLLALADHIGLPDLPEALHHFIHTHNHPKLPSDYHAVDSSFNGPIQVFHSVSIQFYAPSKLCVEGGMRREMIRSNPRLGGFPRYDTMFISTGNDNVDTMNGLLVARVRLLFSYFDAYTNKQVPCALVNWFVHLDDSPAHHPATGMWIVSPEHDEDGHCPMQVICKGNLKMANSAGLAEGESKDNE